MECKNKNGNNKKEICSLVNCNITITEILFHIEIVVQMMQIIQLCF